MNKISIVLLTLACLTPSITLAQSLAEKEKYASEDKQMIASVENTNKQCKTNITLKWDWSNFDKNALKERGAAGFCNEAFSAINSICSDSADGLEAVQKNIKTVTCAYATPRSITLENGNLTFGMNFDAANDRDAVYEFLKNNL